MQLQHTTTTATTHYRLERVLYNVHYQLCTHALQRTTRRGRNLAERTLLVLAVCCFGALWLVHFSFVYRGRAGGGGLSSSFVSTNSSHPSLGMMTRKSKSSIPSSCLQSIPGFRMDADIIHLSLSEETQSYAYPIESFARDAHDEVGGDPDQFQQACASFLLDTGVVERKMESFTQCLVAKDKLFSSPPSTAKTRLTLPVQFSYSKVKGYLLLPPDLCEKRHLQVQHVVVSRFDSHCFGEPFLQRLIFSLTGPDMVMINWLLGLYDASGYVLNPRTDTMIDLKEYYNIDATRKRKKINGMNKFSMLGGFTASTASTSSTTAGSSSSSSSSYSFHQLSSKFTVVLKTSFLFFITTSLVSFTLRETQERMIDFTYQLRETYARMAASGGVGDGTGQQQRQQAQPRQFVQQIHQWHHSPTFIRRATSQVAPLVARHLADNLLFVPIMIGMIFFLVEFYRGDKFLAFMVLSLVWLCEVFTVISLRSSQGLHFFPRIFFLLFSLFHFYLFLYPFGFFYTALASTVLFMTHSMLFFWHRYELPAVAHGLVTVEHPRMSLLASPSAAMLIESELELRQNQQQLNDILSRNTVTHTEAAPFVLLPAARRTTTPTYSQQQQQQQMMQLPSQNSLILSRPASSIGLFQNGGGGDDDNSSYMYFMDGEIVLHRQQPQMSRQTSSPLAVPNSTAIDTVTLNSNGYATTSQGLLQQQQQHLADEESSLNSVGFAVSTATSSNSGVPERIVARTGSSASTATTQSSSALPDAPMIEGRDLFGAAAATTIATSSPGLGLVRTDQQEDPPEISSLQAILLPVATTGRGSHASTPRTDNLSQPNGENHRRRVASAPSVPRID